MMQGPILTTLFTTISKIILVKKHSFIKILKKVISLEIILFFKGCVFFFEPFHSQVSIDLFERMDDNSVVFGWGVDEYQTIRMGSNNSVITQPADYAANLSTLCNFNSVIKQKNHSSNTTIEENKHTVCFVMSDGDNLQWLLNWFITDPRWLGNINRGKKILDGQSTLP